MIRINLEAYSMESAADADCVYDGYYSIIQKVLIKTGFKVFNLDTNMNTNYVDNMPDASVEGIPYNFENVRITGNSCNVTAY